MKVKKVLKVTGMDQKRLAYFLDVSPQAVSAWGENVPWLRQFQIEVMTKGQLKAARRNPAHG